MTEITVSKEFKWEAAHRLVNGYSGKCAHVHGHSWIAIVTLKLKDTASLNEFGFVKDYGDFNLLKKWIDENWDHASLYSVSDKVWASWLMTNNQRKYEFFSNPSSENIAKVLFDQASLLLNDERCEVIEVKIKETCSSEAVYRKCLKDSII